MCLMGTPCSLGIVKTLAAKEECFGMTFRSTFEKWELQANRRPGAAGFSFALDVSALLMKPNASQSLQLTSS